MPNLMTRGLIGFAAGVLSVLTFHQAVWEVLHLVNVPGFALPPAYPTDRLIPYGMPRIVNMCFWGGVYGLVFGLLPSWPRVPRWLTGLAFGIVTAVLALVLVPLIKRYQPGAGWFSLKTYTTMLNITFTYGLPMSGGSWSPTTWLRSLLVNGVWGLGMGLIMALMIPRARRRPADGG